MRERGHRGLAPDRPAIADWLADASKVRFTVPRAAERGAVVLSEPPGRVYDGVAFVEEVSPASSWRPGVVDGGRVTGRGTDAPPRAGPLSTEER